MLLAPGWLKSLCWGEGLGDTRGFHTELASSGSPAQTWAGSAIIQCHGLLEKKWWAWSGSWRGRTDILGSLSAVSQQRAKGWRKLCPQAGLMREPALGSAEASLLPGQAGCSLFQHPQARACRYFKLPKHFSANLRNL